MDSILNSVKQYCGVPDSVSAFDSEILMAINSIMVALKQFGIGPETPFVVTNDSQEWSDLLGEDPVGGVREYVCMRSRLLFDPPANNQIMGALKEQISEFEWRILADADKKAEANSDG